MQQTHAEMTIDAVRAEMARRRASVRVVSDGTGISKSSLQRRLEGKYPFTITQLSAIARFLNVPLAALLPLDQDAA